MRRRWTTFDRLLEDRAVLVADGAMGTMLFDLGLSGGECPEFLNVDRPELVRQVHEEFVSAGADIVLTNTFGGNARRLALHEGQDRVGEVNAAAVEIARAVADGADRPVAVAGSIGPTGDLFEPLGPLSHQVGVDVFSAQAEALVDAGVDVLWIETLSSWAELEASVEAASVFDVPVAATMSFDTAGRTMMGISGSDLGRWWGARSEAPNAVGANCGIGPGDAVSVALEVTSVAADAVVITKANCGMPSYDADRLAYPIGPERMDDYVELAVRAGARIVGACCGSTPHHIAAIRAAVDAGVAGERPDRTEVEERLDASPAPAVPGPRRRRRR